MLFPRLTPSYMFAILFYSNLYAFLGEGPYWFIRQNSTSCEKYWWTNLLYINNFYPTHLGDEVRYTLVVSLYRNRRRVKIFSLAKYDGYKASLAFKDGAYYCYCVSYWWFLPIQ